MYCLASPPKIGLLLALKELPHQSAKLFVRLVHQLLDLVRFLLIPRPAWAGLHCCNDISRLEMIQIDVSGGQIGVAELLGDHHDVVALVQQVNRP